jgi:hypothetical protein
MANNILEWMEEFWRDSAKYNPLHKPIEKMMQTDSQNMRRIGNAIGWQGLEDEATKNADDPVRGVARASLAAGGIFAAPYVYGAMTGGGAGGAAAASQEVLAAQQALAAAKTAQEIAAAEQALQAALAAQEAAAAASSSGMFAQVPGVTPGSQQAQMLAAQNAGFGGAGADMTAKSAMSAVKDAYGAGKMGTMDYLGNVAKADMAGMNDPSVWMDRFSRNYGRIAGNASKARAVSGMFAQPQQQRPAPMPQPQQQQPLTTPYGSASPEVERLMKLAAAGDKQAIEELKRMGIDLRSMA